MENVLSKIGSLENDFDEFDKLIQEYKKIHSRIITKVKLNILIENHGSYDFQ